MVLAAAALSGRVQQNIGIIRAGVARGLTSTQIQATIRSTGQAGLRRTDLLAGIRQAKGIEESASRIRNVRRGLFPDPSRIQVARGVMVSRFSYEVRIGPRMLPDGTLNRKFLTIRSNTNLRPEDILNEAENALAAAPDEVGYGRIRADEALTLVGAVRRGT